ncbi:armadillo-type protein [Chiua virens]|nr:armadillo-type protein [Chiua virens]
MDLQALANLFATTYNADPNIQKAGELQIRKIGAQEGMLTAILQIIASDSVDLYVPRVPAPHAARSSLYSFRSTRQACSVYLKNRVHTSYIVDNAGTRPEQVPIAQSDRDALKSNILRLLANSPSRTITVQLGATFKDLVSHDFPERWEGLLDDVNALLNSGDIREVGAGCVTALECVRAFRYRQAKDHLPIIVPKLFPTLVTVASSMLNTPPSAAQEIPSMLHLILKTYKTSIIINLSAHQQSPESLVPWGRLLFQVVNLSLPSNAVPENEEEREKSEWWKAKKWAYATLGRLFHRFGNPSQLPSPLQKEYGAFANHFVTAFAPEIFKVYLQQVELYVSKQAWLSKKCQYQIFQFFTACIKPKSTWILLKPHVETLVASFVFPHLCFNPADQELWDSDPVEYVRASVDEYENVSSPVSGAISFILSLVNDVLRSNAAAPQKFGALNITAALGPFIMRHPEVKGSMEEFMMRHVLPEYTANEPYMRSIACEVLGTVTKHSLEWSNPESLAMHSNAVANALDDPELPVRVQAALALTQMVVAYETVRSVVSPRVGEVVRRLLKLSDETDLDLLNTAMESMVEQFQDELLPVATELTGRLCESYLRLAKEGLAQASETSVDSVDIDTMLDSDEDKVYGAMGVAKTISTIVSSVESNQEILRQVQEVVIPIIRFTLENKLIDLFDNMYELMDTLTFKLASISPNMWPIFELTYTLFKSDAVDFLDEMLPSLDNILSYGAAVFKARPDYREKLAESILLNLAGHVDDHLQSFIKIAIDNIDGGNTYAFKLTNLIVLVNAIFYNPAAALHLMESYKPGSARLFFDRWFAAINTESKLPRVHDKKLSLLALSKLMEIDGAMIPASLQEGWYGIVAGALVIFKSLPQAISKRKALEQSLIDDEDEEDDDESRYLNLEGEDDGKTCILFLLFCDILNVLRRTPEDVWDEDSAYLEMLANESARLRARSQKMTEEGDDLSEESEESEIEEELGFFSLIDAINPYTTFKHALTTFQTKNPALYQAATTTLSVDQQTVLMEVMSPRRIAESDAVKNIKNKWEKRERRGGMEIPPSHNVRWFYVLL